MTASIRSRAVHVLSTTVFTFLLMGALAAVSTIARDAVFRPTPVVVGVNVSLSPVRMNQQLALVPKLSFPSYQEAYEKQQQQWAEEERREKLEEEQQQQAAQAAREEASRAAPAANPLGDVDEEANDFGNRGRRRKSNNNADNTRGDLDGFSAAANRLLTSALVAAVDRLAALPIIGPYFEGRAGVSQSHRRRRPSARRSDDMLSYDLTHSVYVNASTGVVEDNLRPIPADKVGMVEPILAHYPQLLAFERSTDSMSLSVSAFVDLSSLWDWNTKAIFVAFVARYTTHKAAVNEVVFVDAVVRHIHLPWSLRHLQGMKDGSHTPEERAAYTQFLASVRHPVHDARGVFIDHIQKTVIFQNAAKYPVVDLYADTLNTAEIAIVMRYQVMSYSGWAPVQEMPLRDAAGRPVVVVPSTFADNTAERA